MNSSLQTKSIPAILRFDVEPDFHDGSDTWEGFERYFDVVNTLRSNMQNLNIKPFKASWFIRFDPEIERRFSSGDYIAATYGELLRQLKKKGDAFGIHIHMHRWDEDRQALYSDHSQHDWARHCLRSSVEVFKKHFGYAPRFMSAGGYYFEKRLIDEARQLGIEVDVSIEPGLDSKTEDPSLGTYVEGTTCDYTNFPQLPYYPSDEAIHKPDSQNIQNRMLLIPLTSFNYEHHMKPWHKKLVRKLLGRTSSHLPLNPWKTWKSPKTYWDLVEAAMTALPHPCFIIAIRTDSPKSETFQRAACLLDYLPQHPLSKRLRFTDPLDSAFSEIALQN